MAQRYIFAQTDFGGGQVDEDAHLREDAKVMKTAARLMSNWRQRNTGTLQVRPGRNAFSLTTAPRCERFRMSAQQELILAFSTGAVAILDRTGTTIASNSSGSYLWTNSTVNQINWTLTPDRVVICYPGMQPQIILWNESANTFSFAAFTFRSIGFQVNEPFFRLAAPGATMTPTAQTGTTTLTCSVPFFTNAMIGQQISLCGQQAQITVVGSSTPITTCTIVIAAGNSLSTYFQVTTSGVSVPAVFPLNTLAETALDKITIEVGTTSVNTVNGTLLSGVAVTGINTTGNTLVSAWGAATIGAQATITTAQPTVTWQQEFMNAANGWPSACFFVQGRLGFCDFPQRPDAVLMSATGLYDVFFVDSAAAINNPNAGVNANAAILVFISGQPHVRNVVEWNGDIFVFTDQGVYRIPTTGTVVTPGTISFQKITDATASAVKPLVTKEAVIFISASNDRVSSIVRTGNFTTPYVEQDLTIFHSQLINNPVTVAVGHGDDGFPERYIYVLNSDGSLVIGRVQDDRSFVGWLPWTGAGFVSWISSSLFDVLFTTLYGLQYILEYENVGYFIDHAVLFNSPPANMLSGGNGAYIAFAGGQVRVMDGTVDYGLRSVDSTGHLIKNPDDDFSRATVVAGAQFVSQFKPFLEEAPRGQAVGQRQRLRKITRAIVSVYGSSGFTFGGRTIPPVDFGQGPFPMLSIWFPAAQTWSQEAFMGAVGTEFFSSVNTSVAGIAFWKLSNDTNAGPRNFALWTVPPNPTLLAVGRTAMEETGTSAWVQALFPVPIPITANTHYVIMYDVISTEHSVFNSITWPVTNGTITGVRGWFNALNSAPPLTADNANVYGADVIFAPPITLKETSYTARFLGRAFDPQVLLLKDAPGPLTIVEFVQEATV